MNTETILALVILLMIPFAAYVCKASLDKSSSDRHYNKCLRNAKNEYFKKYNDINK